MLIEKLCDLFFKVFTTLLNFINLPSMPDLASISNYITMIIDNGAVLVNYFIPKNIFVIGLPLLIIISTFQYVYYFIMWIIHKIPAASIR